MLNRWLGILLAAGMLLMNAEILRRDVLESYLASTPPANYATSLDPNEERLTQVGIYDEAGHKMGISETRAHKTSFGGVVTVTVNSSTDLYSFALPNGMVTPAVAIDTYVTYHHEQGDIDEVDFRMAGLGFPVWLHGEAMGTGEFPFRWQVGKQKGEMILDSRIPGTMGNLIRPFDELPGLYVGRKWRLDLLDAVAPLLPQFAGRLELEPVEFEVTGQEMIAHGGKLVETFVVEGGGSKAWVARNGRVLRQTLRLPLFGQLELRDEQYDGSMSDRLHKAASGPAAKAAAAPDSDKGADDTRSWFQRRPRWHGRHDRLQPTTRPHAEAAES